MKLYRMISVYEKEGDGLYSEYSLNETPLEKLREIIKAKENDHELLQVYLLGKTELKLFAALVPALQKINFSEFHFYYECCTV